MKSINKLIITLLTVIIATTAIAYMKKNKQSAPTVSASNFYFEELAEQLHDHSHDDLREIYLNHCSSKEQQLHTELSAIIDMKQLQNDIIAKAEEVKDRIKSQKDDKSVSARTKQFIIEIGKTFNIKPEDFVIVHEDMGASPAMVYESIFYVNEKLFNTYDYDARYFVVGHEFSHMIHHDAARLTCLKKQLDLSNPDHQGIFDRINRFQEARADMFASTKDKKFAEGGLNFFTELYNRHGNQIGNSHPKTTERVEAHKTVIALHNQGLTIA